MACWRWMLLHEARRSTQHRRRRVDPASRTRDRSRWDRARIAEARSLVEQALASRRATARTACRRRLRRSPQRRPVAETDWHEIIGLYDALLRLAPSPVVELNRAVAVACATARRRAGAGRCRCWARGELRDYRFAHAARAADLCRRLGHQGRGWRCHQSRWHLSRRGRATFSGPAELSRALRAPKNFPERCQSTLRHSTTRHRQPSQHAQLAYVQEWRCPMQPRDQVHHNKPVDAGNPPKARHAETAIPSSGSRSMCGT